jgi:hypothetical protein
VTEPLALPAEGESSTDALMALAARLVDVRDPVVLVAPGLIVAPRALSPLTEDPFVATALLVRPGGSGADVRVRHHVVTSVASGFHEVTAPDHRSVGALAIGVRDAPAAAAAVAGLVACISSGAVSTDGTDLVELVAVAVTRAGIGVRAVDMVRQRPADSPIAG